MVECSFDQSRILALGYLVVMRAKDELVRRACRGDRLAQDVLSEQLAADLQKLLPQQGCPWQDVEDLIQDTMLVVWKDAQKKHADSDAETFRRWATGIGLMKLRDMRKKQWRRAPLDRQFEHEQNVQPTPLSVRFSEAEQTAIMLRNLERLRTSWRSLVRHMFAGGKYKEYAQRKDIKVQTVRNQFGRAVKRIKRLVDEERRTPSHS